MLAAARASQAQVLNPYVGYVKSQRLRVRAQRVPIRQNSLEKAPRAAKVSPVLWLGAVAAASCGSSLVAAANRTLDNTTSLYRAALARRGGSVLYVYVCSAEREAQVLSPEGG